MWILFSDQILAMLVGDTHTLTYIQTLKGCFYVSVTAVLVYLLVERGARTAHATLERRVEERTVQLRQYQEHLEDLVRERTKQLEVEINERKLVQTERERLIGELEARNSELEQFAYTVSHDLKSPLITVTSYLGASGKIWTATIGRPSRTTCAGWLGQPTRWLNCSTNYWSYRESGGSAIRPSNSRWANWSTRFWRLPSRRSMRAESASSWPKIFRPCLGIASDSSRSFRT